MEKIVILCVTPSVLRTPPPNRGRNRVEIAFCAVFYYVYLNALRENLCVLCGLKF
jgi:hypothetical protein